jgi:SnoaL-like domain
MHNAELQQLVTERAIERVAREIDRAVDDKDWTAMRRHFADKVTVDIGAVTGNELIEMSGEQFVAEVAALNVVEKVSYHVHNDVLVTMEGERAALTAHSYGWNFCKRFDPPLYEVWGTIDYRFTRQDGRWLVHHVKMAKWRESGNAAVSAWRGI